MKAQVIRQFGDPSVFQAADLSAPALKPGHVIIRVAATSVNPIDCKIRSGKVQGLAADFPAVLHGDAAGVIAATAPDVHQFKTGDEVYGCAGGLRGSGGALAEYMLADANLLAKKPRKFSMQQAAALPLVAITAWDALFNKAKLEPGQSVLIHGGVGGVGHIAIQLAKWRGAKVYATVTKDEDFSLVKSMGALEAINAFKEEVPAYVQRLTDERGFDVVFDTIGGPNLDRSFAAAAMNGCVATTAARTTHDLSPMHAKSLSLHAVYMLLPLLTGIGREAHGQALAKIAEVADQGLIKPLIDEQVFTLETISQAHAFLESGKALGKVVVNVC